MTSIRPVVTGTDLRTAETTRRFRIPGGSADVGLQRLGGEQTAGGPLLVDFPADWLRGEPGHYRAAEEFLVVAGELTIDGVVHAVGDWAWLAAGHRRSHTVVAETGARAVAWFDGDPRWVSGGYHVPSSPPRRRALLDAPVLDLELPLPLHGERLRGDARTSSWLLAEVPAGVAAETAAQLVDLTTFRWWAVPAGEPLPDVDGHALLRLEQP